MNTTSDGQQHMTYYTVSVFIYQKLNQNVEAEGEKLSTTMIQWLHLQEQ